MASEITTATPGEVSAGLPPALRRRLQEAFRRGKQLSAERSFDYAHELFTQCMTQDPGNLQFVETMLANLRAKFGDDKKKVRRLLTLGSSRGLKKAMARQDWQEAMRLGAEQLKTNPWHVSTLRALAEVCEALHHNEVELAYLKQALEANPKDAEVNRHCARSLARMAQFDQAIACWHRVELIRPGDKEATKMVFQLNEEKLLHAAALRDLAAQRRTEAAANETAPAEEIEETTQEPQEVTLSPRQRLERAIAEDPTNVEHYLELSELLIDEQWWSEAERVLEQCLSACGEEPRVREQLERVRTLRLEEQQRELAARQPEEKPPIRLPWLEIVLACAAVALVLQFAPGLMSGLAEFITSHSKILLFAANVVVLAVLVGIRFGPDVKQAWQARKQRKQP